MLAGIGAARCGSSGLAGERCSAAYQRAAAMCGSQALGLLTVQPGAERSCPVVFSFPRGKCKSSAGNLKDTFFSSFFFPPGELADIFWVKFVLKNVQHSAGTVSILSCLLKNVIVWFVLSLPLFFPPI